MNQKLTFNFYYSYSTISYTPFREQTKFNNFNQIAQQPTKFTFYVSRSTLLSHTINTRFTNNSNKTLSLTIDNENYTFSPQESKEIQMILCEPLFRCEVEFDSELSHDEPTSINFEYFTPIAETDDNSTIVGTFNVEKEEWYKKIVEDYESKKNEF